MLELPESYAELNPVVSKDLAKIDDFLKTQENGFFPPYERLFAALKMTPLPQVKVVILGQDPYHDDNQACGLAFSVPRSQPKLPPSLRNIFKELKNDCGIENCSGDLSLWAAQGVLLLNTVLSVEPHKPLSHREIGWQKITDEIIAFLNRKCGHLIFVLWGNPAQTKLRLIDTAKHTVLCSVHPSPLSASRGFFGSRPFSKINADLAGNGKTPIDWAIKNEDELF